MQASTNYLNDTLRAAIIDYRHLLDRGYPVQATIKLVGDRYRLDRAGRIIMFRGVLDEETSSRIAGRLVVELPRRASLCIDGYNVLFTLANYRSGHPLFIGTDGLLRDAGGSHGRFATGTAFAEALEALIDALPEVDPDRVVFYLGCARLDQPRPCGRDTERMRNTRHYGRGARGSLR